MDMSSSLSLRTSTILSSIVSVRTSLLWCLVHCVLRSLFHCRRFLSPKNISILVSWSRWFAYFVSPLLLTLRTAGSVVFVLFTLSGFLFAFWARLLCAFSSLSRSFVPSWDPWHLGVPPILGHFLSYVISCSYLCVSFCDYLVCMSLAS